MSGGGRAPGSGGGGGGGGTIPPMIGGLIMSVVAGLGLFASLVLSAKNQSKSGT